MSVTLRPYRRGGWEADIRFRLPNGRRYRERGKAPGTSRSAAQRWAEDRERHLLLHGPEHKPQLAKEVPTLKEFATRFLEEHAEANRQKPSGIAAKESILRMHLMPALGFRKLDAIRNEDVQRLKSTLRDKATEDREQRADGSERTAEEGSRVGGHRYHAVHDQGATRRPTRGVVPRLRRVHASGRGGAHQGLADTLDRSPRWRRRASGRGDGGTPLGRRGLLTQTARDQALRLAGQAHGPEERARAVRPAHGATVRRASRVPSPARTSRAVQGRRAPLSRQSAWTRVRRAVARGRSDRGAHPASHVLLAPGDAGRARHGDSGAGGTPGDVGDAGYMHLSPDVLGSSIRLLESRPRLASVETLWRRPPRKTEVEE